MGSGRSGSAQDVPGYHQVSRDTGVSRDPGQSRQEQEEEEGSRGPLLGQQGLPRLAGPRGGGGDVTGSLGGSHQLLVQPF